MGPLVPEIIGNELNYIVALFVGIGFGFILEQAGFSTSKKLVGLFYGYDFTVLRVFFTAGVTAMIGVIALNHFGLIDINLVYVNPTFLWSAIVGGIIMGLGFVIGGYCPGTSVCAAAIGKTDAMVFIAGSFLGVFVFAEGYPVFEGLYKASNWGSPRLFESLGISQALFAFLLIVVAVGAFWMTTSIENKVNGKPNPEFKPIKLYVGLTGIAFVVALSAFILPDRREELINKVSDESYIKTSDVRLMTNDELAFRLIDDDNDLQIIDMRTAKEFNQMSLPKSTNFTLQNLFDKEAHQLLSLKGKRNVFMGNKLIDSKKAALLAMELGYKDVYALEGGLNKFKTDIIEFTHPQHVNSRNEADTYRFRIKAKEILPVLIMENKLKQAGTVKVKPKRVIGGC